MPNKHYIGFILLALIFTFSLPQEVHGESVADLQDKIKDHSRKAGAYASKRQWSQCENEQGLVLRYMHKFKRKCRGIFRRCRITDKKAFYQAFAIPYSSRGYCRAAQKNYGGARSDANAAVGWNNNYFGDTWCLRWLPTWKTIYLKQGSIIKLY